MISVEQAMRLHDHVIRDHGGSPGVRDQAGLLAALGRPYATFGGEDLYKDVYEQPPRLARALL